MTNLEQISADFVSDLHNGEFERLGALRALSYAAGMAAVTPSHIVVDHVDETANRRVGVLVRGTLFITIANVDFCATDTFRFDAYVSFASGEPRLVQLDLDDIGVVLAA